MKLKLIWLMTIFNLFLNLGREYNNANFDKFVYFEKTRIKPAQ